MVPKLNDTSNPVDPVFSNPAVIWTDGGCINLNPSPFGGTWAFLYAPPLVPWEGEMKEDIPLTERSGAVTPADIELSTVSNNVTELLAILLALECVPEQWSGAVYSDSLNAIRRAENPRTAKMAGVPTWMRDRLVAAVDRVRPVTYVLYGGHPTKAELAAGKRADGKPCHRHNVRCDKLCSEAAYRWLADATNTQV